MFISRRTLVALAAGVLLAAASAQAQPVAKQAVATPAPGPVDTDNRSLLGLIAPALTDPVEHRAGKTCGASKLYSSHDVVGDPEACFMGRLDVHGGMSSGSTGAF